MDYNEKTSKQKLIDKIYKLLPIYEGKIINSDIAIGKDSAYANFQRNINMLILQIFGIIKKTGKKEYLQDIYFILEGLKDVGTDNQIRVRNTIFDCVRLVKKLDDDFMDI